jgi:hypothetical protein
MNTRALFIPADFESSVRDAVGAFFAMIQRIESKLAVLKRSLFTSWRKLLGRSDYHRWRDRQNLLSCWDPRTQRIAQLVDSGKSVLEFGAGKCLLRDLLPSSCSYTPSDLVARDESMFVCDLNSAALPDFGSHDVAVFSGVLEYINDIPRLVVHLSGHVNTIVTSYAAVDTNSGNRRAQGWVNDYSVAQLLTLFSNAGFRCDYMETWDSQFIFRFIKR